MSHLVDWNFQILPSFSGTNLDTDVTFSAMKDCAARFDVKSFFLLARYDPRLPVSLQVAKRNAFAKELSKLAKRPLSLQTASCIPLHEGISGIDGLELLAHKKSGYLPLSLPIAPYADWMDAELNRLLYTRHTKLLFLSFELALILYPEEVVRKLMRIQDSAFQFGYKSLVSKPVQEAVKALLHNKKPVLLGTGLDRADKIFDYDLSGSLETAKNAFSAEEWRMLLSFSISIHAIE